MVKDAIGKILQVGDLVVFPDSYGDLYAGTVERFTPYYVVIVKANGDHERKAPSKVAKVD